MDVDMADDTSLWNTGDTGSGGGFFDTIGSAWDAVTANLPAIINSGATLAAAKINQQASSTIMETMNRPGVAENGMFGKIASVGVEVEISPAVKLAILGVVVLLVVVLLAHFAGKKG